MQKQKLNGIDPSIREERGGRKRKTNRNKKLFESKAHANSNSLLSWAANEHTMRWNLCALKGKKSKWGAMMRPPSSHGVLPYDDEERKDMRTIKIHRRATFLLSTIYCTPTYYRLKYDIRIRFSCNNTLDCCSRTMQCPTVRYDFRKMLTRIWRWTVGLHHHTLLASKLTRYHIPGGFLWPYKIMIVYPLPTYVC